MTKINTYIIPVLNNYQGALDLIKSLKKYTPDNYYIFIINNGYSISQPDAIHLIKELKKEVHLWIDPYRNLGFGKAMNTGIKLATTEFITLANDDVKVLYSEWWEEVMTKFKEDSRLGGFNPHSFCNKTAGGDRVCQYEIKCQYTEEDIKKMKEIFKAEREYTGCCTFFTICKKAMFDEVGLFDESFGIGSGEDYDLCYDKETQIMTKNGIKFIKDISFGDEILTMNGKGIIEYQKPTNIIKKFEKKLLHFKSKRLDIKCSKEQNLLVGYEYKISKKQKKDGKKFIKKDIDFIKAWEINNKLQNGYYRQCRYFVKKNGGIWQGKKGKKDFVRFMGWYLSEGCIDNRPRYNEIIISQSLKNKNNRKEIVEIIKSLGYKPNIGKRGIRFSDKKLKEYLKQFGKCQEKFIPQEIKDLSPSYLNLFLDAYIKGDGNYRNDGFNIVTCSNKMKDDLIELLLKTENTFNINYIKPQKIKFPSGKSYDCKGCWQIQVRTERKEKAYLRRANLVSYNDYSFDITVPNHKIYIIRNGKGCWSSNCIRAARKNWLIKGGSSTMIFHWWGKTKDDMPEGIGISNYDLIAGGNQNMIRKWNFHCDEVQRQLKDGRLTEEQAKELNRGWSVAGKGGPEEPLDKDKINYKDKKWYQEIDL